jgi:hypothetical protein
VVLLRKLSAWISVKTPAVLINDAGAGFSRLSLDSILERRLAPGRRLEWQGPRLGGVVDR